MMSITVLISSQDIHTLSGSAVDAEAVVEHNTTQLIPVALPDQAHKVSFTHLAYYCTRKFSKRRHRVRSKERKSIHH
jgi:hypothetical protein